MITRAQAKLIRRLRSRKRREEEGAFLVEGVRLVEELLAEGGVELVVTAPALESTVRGRRLRERIDAGSWAHAKLSDGQLAELADTETPQGVLAVARQPRRALSEFVAPASAAVLVLDRVADPGNLGTLLRTARALGVAWLVALPGSVDPWNPKAVRASAGAIFRLPVSRDPWPDVVAWLRAHEFVIFCADPGGEPLVRCRARHDRFALVLGNEPTGLSEEVRRDSDRRLAVPLAGGMDSLNVAVAGALLLDRLLGGARRADD